MKKRLFLGIDTSNYTTSMALVSEDGELVANLKRPLPVKSGECGLRQSDAVFHHTANMPSLVNEVRDYLTFGEIVAIGVSEKPRNVEGSYMPCFLVGCSVAESLSAFLSVPLFKFSHQCGHIMAAIFSSARYELLEKEHAAFHVSGGTTELVRVVPTSDGFSTTLVGGTLDLNAGQAIDRIGVSMGVAFPAGRELEILALQNTEKLPRKPIRCENAHINLSGLQNMAENLYSKSRSKPFVAAFVFDYIGRALSAMMHDYKKVYGDSEFLFAGGVMCNSLVRSVVSKEGICYFADPALSADNAVGVAALALRKYTMGK